MTIGSFQVLGWFPERAKIAAQKRHQDQSVPRICEKRFGGRLSRHAEIERRIRLSVHLGQHYHSNPNFVLRHPKEQGARA